MSTAAMRQHQLVSRRQALQVLASVSAGLHAAACTPLRIALKIHPQETDADSPRVHRILRSFATAVVPGSQPDDPNVSRVFYDEFYPLANVRSFFAADLCERSAKVLGANRFETCSLNERERVIDDGLSRGGTIGRLYTGAVYLTQIAYLAGIYDDEAGCPLIDFEGRFRPRPLAETTYPDAVRYLATAVTPDGNPA